MSFSIGSIPDEASALSAALLPYFSLKARPFEPLIKARQLPEVPSMLHDLLWFQEHIIAHFKLLPKKESEQYVIPDALFDYQTYAAIYFKVNFNYLQGTLSHLIFS